jgi:hypothetical protein
LLPFYTCTKRERGILQSEYLFRELFLCYSEHQIDPVLLIDFGGGRIIIDGCDICLREQLTDPVGDAFAGNMVWQTAEWLGTDNICIAAFNENIPRNPLSLDSGGIGSL